MPELRIVSLVPAATEIVGRLGLGHALVGRSHVCNFPSEALAAPVLTRVALDADASRDIHNEVRSRLAEGLALFDVDLDGLRAAAPTHLLVQDQCSVCAVSPADLEAALADWLDPKPELLRLAPHQLIDVWSEIEAVGRALGHESAAQALRQKLTHHLSDLAEEAGMLRGERARPRVACVEWLDPIMIAGHWVPELIRLAGGEPILSEVGGPSRTVSLAELLEAAPDILVIEPCGFDLERTQKEWAAHGDIEAAFAGRRGSDQRLTRIALADGDAYFNRPGPRLVESAEVLAEIIAETTAPNRRPRPHLGQGWRPISGFDALKPAPSSTD